MTVFKNRQFRLPSGEAAQDCDPVIARMWADKFDTVDIARRVGKPESYVANRLAALRDAGRR